MVSKQVIESPPCHLVNGDMLLTDIDDCTVIEYVQKPLPGVEVEKALTKDSKTRGPDGLTGAIASP